MTQIPFQDGKVVFRDGTVGTGQECCCNQEEAGVGACCECGLVELWPGGQFGPNTQEGAQEQINGWEEFRGDLEAAASENGYECFILASAQPDGGPYIDCENEDYEPETPCEAFVSTVFARCCGTLSEETFSVQSPTLFFLNATVPICIQDATTRTCVDGSTEAECDATCGEFHVDQTCAEEPCKECSEDIDCPPCDDPLICCGEEDRVVVLDNMGRRVCCQPGAVGTDEFTGDCVDGDGNELGLPYQAAGYRCCEGECQTDPCNPLP